MSHTRLLITAAIIALVIGIGFAFSVPHTRDIIQAPKVEEVPIVPSVALHDVFKKGTHTITGSLLAPNACAVVSAEASLMGDASSTESILVAVSMPPSEGVCLELPTLITFSTTITASANLPLTATVNGLAATTTSS